MFVFDSPADSASHLAEAKERIGEDRPMHQIRSHGPWSKKKGQRHHGVSPPTPWCLVVDHTTGLGQLDASPASTAGPCRS